ASPCWAFLPGLSLRVVTRGAGWGERAGASGGLGGLLLAQGLDGARSLGGRRGEHVRSLVERCLERAGGLAQQHLAALEAGELVDVLRRQHPPLEHSALDDRSEERRLGEACRARPPRAL